MKSTSRIGIALGVLLLNGLMGLRALQLFERHLEQRLPRLTLMDAPEANQMVDEREALTWRWNQSVAPNDLIGKALESSPVTLTPDVEGVFIWQDDRTLEFQPSSSWESCLPLSFSWLGSLTNGQGIVQAVNSHGSIIGPSLRLERVSVMSLEPGKELPLELLFSAPVTPSVLREYLTFVDAGSSELSYTLRQTPVPNQFLVNLQLRDQPLAHLNLRKGLPSVYGPLGALAEDMAKTVHLPLRFAFSGLSTSAPTFGQPCVSLKFNSRAALRGLRDQLTLEPPVDVSMGAGNWWERNQVKLTGNFEPGTTYTLRLHANTQGMNGQTLASEVTRSFTIPERRPGIRFRHKGSLLNAHGSRRVQVDVVNETELEVTLERVYDNNLIQYLVRASGLAGWQSEHRPSQRLAETVWKTSLPVPSNVVDSVQIDLSDAIEAGGNGVYRLLVDGKNSSNEEERHLLVSDVGLLARKNPTEILCWVTRLSTGDPIEGSRVELWSTHQQALGKGVSDANGLVNIPVSETEENGSFLLVAETGGELGVLRLNQTQRPFPADPGERSYLDGGHEAFLYTDRGMYRHGETLHLRGIIRGAAMETPPVFPVELRLLDPARLRIWKTNVVLNAFGTVECDIPLGPDIASGSYRIECALPGNGGERLGHTSINVESFVPPQIVVDAECSGGDTFVNPSFEILASARYLYGAPAAAHKAKVLLTVSPETFRSSEFPDHLFSDERKGTFDRRTTPVGSAKTNAEGSATFRVKVPEDLRIPSALRAVVGVTVQEFSGRGANAFLSRRVDVLPYYLGLKLGSPDEDGCIEVDVLAVDREGRQVHDDRVIQLSWERLVSSRGYRRDASGTFTYVSETIPMPEGRQRMALKNGRGRVKVPVSEHARIRVNVTDEGQGVSASRCITTGAAVAAPERADRVKLELNKEGVSAGDEVELRIHAPFSGNALITLETDRVLEQWVEPVPGEEHSIRFTVPDIPQPNFWVRVTAIRPQPVEGAHPVLRSDGALAVRMDRDGFRMNVNLVVPDHVLPGRNQRVEVQVDPGAEVVVAAVDEGILRLNGFETPNPFRWFQKLRRNGLIQWDMFDALLPELGTRFRSGDPKMGGGGSSMGTRLNPVQGKRFKPLALWSGTLLADTNGIAIFDAPLPEFSGSIRWMAVAVGTNRLGAAGKTSRVSRPVVVQQSLPLFLSPGDETEWTFRIQNMTQEEKEIQMTPQLSGPVEIEWKGEAVTLQAGETRVMRIPLRAGKDVGVASCSITVRDGDEQWNDLIELTVRPAEPWRSRQRIVTVEAGKEVKFPAWANVMASTAERKLQMSVMPSLQLAGALDYLVRYPYGCVEQTVSSAFPLLYVPELAPESWKENQVKAQIQSGIFRLWRMQLRDGSFGYWPGARQASESGTIYALEFLLAANQRGFEVDSGRLKAGLACVTRWMKDAGFDNGGSMSNVRTARICALLAGADQLEHGWRQRLWEKRGALPSLGRIYAAEAFLLSGDPDRAGRMLENLPLSSLKSWSWQSHVSQKAECLRVLAAWNPWDPRVPGLASSVLSDQRKGRWESTYENASVIRALAVVQALALPAGSEPRVLMKPHGEASTMETNQFYQVEANEALVVKNMGTTTVYLQEIRNGVASSPEEVNGSIQVTRRFLRTDGTELDTLDVKQGDLVLIEIELSGLVEELEHLVISERLPAGLELLPVKTQRTLEHVVSWDGVMKGQACTHMEIRDDRALLFPTPVGGDARFYLLTRAVTPGRYLAPASYVEGMYDETQQGQGEPVSVRVLP